MPAETLGIFLDGTFGKARGGGTFVVHDPADGSEFALVSEGTADDAATAMDSAARAQPAWEAMGGATRSKFLLRAAEYLREGAEDLARTITREMGKVLYESRLEVQGAIDNLEYYAAFGRTLAGEEVAMLPRGETVRLLWLPRGVVVGITPWNFPAATVTRKIGPALVAGNTMVVKPSSATPLSTLRIAEAFRRAGLPPGVLNVVPGPGGKLGPSLLQHPACSTVTLTGSTESGREVLRLAAPRVVKCLLELGGKAPVIVAADADLDWAVRATVWSRFWNAGQACIAAERTYVERSVRDEFLRKVDAMVSRLRVGPGLSPHVDIGPVYSVGARDGIARMVEAAERAGATASVGGKIPTEGALQKGAFYPPTVLSGVSDSNPVAKDEIFGPVLPVLEFSDFDDAIARANASDYGLSSYVFTRDLTLAEKAQRELRFGETYVNRAGPETPQGYHAGFRQSGLGGEGTRWGVQDYLQLKTVYVDWHEPHSADYFLPYPD
ncbi:MAG TPA: aldehyde dehydrogenase family protein [Thermoplasmata archaeon]|nr:aldehyde dehydrogenase family protein [Thermoplasmata archaeon]